MASCGHRLSYQPPSRHLQTIDDGVIKIPLPRIIVDVLRDHRARQAKERIEAANGWREYNDGKPKEWHKDAPRPYPLGWH